MKEGPMLFSAPMVRALLDGSKKQTRRIMKPQPVPIPGEPGKHWWPSNAAQSMMRVEDGFQKHPGIFDDACPHGQPGNRIWVRETFCLDDDGHEEWPVFRADGAKLPQRQPTRKPARWTPSIHMPRAASRILLEIVSVRVERLNDCSEADALAEGVKAEPCDHVRLSCEEIGCCGPTAKGMYAALWDHINGAGAWADNPWVWVIEFKRVTP
ncbi:hypothetical protein J3P46_08620 [Janthinobacterium lividum]|uniref:Morphogenetic protein n=1 Tax=Janthinobacterium lividum TaxID=29581 RepID=A0AAJ4MXU9_9BURK|nr:hypothetical protein F3B38_08710 [Janthinobacterium lividum]QSX99103.1 hypothetical protein J3P46_08620 [Janthinobacterium lividum]